MDKNSWRNGGGDLASVSPRQTTLQPTFTASPSISSLIAGNSISLDDDLEGYSSSDNEQSQGITLAARLEELKINPAAYRFTGKSSGGKIVASAMAMRNRLKGAGPQTAEEMKKEFRFSRPEYWKAQPVCLASLHTEYYLTSSVGTSTEQAMCSPPKSILLS